MQTTRFTREQIASRAQDHVAYGWSRRPGTNDRNMEWTAEDTQIYNEEYDRTRTETAPAKNPNCDNDKCRHSVGEVRVLPTGGDSNAILCNACYRHEMAFRRDRNRELAKDCQFKLPAWDSLKVYGSITEKEANAKQD